MPFLNRDQVYSRFKSLGHNSSHFVWLLTPLQFYETRLGWIFGFRQVRDVVLIALDPMMPRRSEQGGLDEEFESAWLEFNQTVKPKIVAFIGIYDPWIPSLKKMGFQTLKVGKEPWIRLENCIPRGNTAKGVRSARNQALRAGISVVEWTAQEVQNDSGKQVQLKRLLRFWRGARLLHLNGFLNAADPLAYAESRRYFVAMASGGKICAYLIASPIPKIQSFFLEDLVIGKGAPRGVAELLVLESMVVLRESGGHLASLGVVALTSLEVPTGSGTLPFPVQRILSSLPRVLAAFYNFRGLEVFRKRFKPDHWQTIFVALRNNEGSGYSNLRAWIQVLWALVIAFEAKLELTPEWVKQKLQKPFLEYPVTGAVAVFSGVLFAGVNRFGKLPDWALTRFGFSGGAPVHEWLTRSIMSDYLYFDPVHFWFFGGALIFILAWAERTQKRGFLIGFFISLSVFDDFIDYFLIIKPFHYLRPALFNHLITVKDVGGSLAIFALLGLQITRFRKNREILFVFLVLGTVFSLVYSSIHYHYFIGNLNHFLFLCLGYLVGKLKFEYDRNRSKRASKNKPPISRSVLNSIPGFNGAKTGT